MDAKTRNPGYEAVRWDLASLRKAWNQIKAEVAPWWEDNSKECYSSGIADLATALSNWKASKDGKRKGRKVGFPEFKSRNLDRSRVRFTTGGMRLEDDRRHITLPVIGTLRSKENTRNVQRPIAKGYGRLLNMTLSERWGRLFVSVNYAVRTPNVKAPVKPGVRSGVDLGLRTLATAADTEGNIIETANPAPLRATLAERRRVGKQLSRRIPGSIGHRQAKTKLGRLDRRAVHIRRETWHSSTTWLVSTYGEIVVEDLDIAAMKKGMGRRAFRRSVFDAALGMAGPMLEYKKARTGTVVIKADRWFASSQIHHGCGCRLPARTKIAKQLVCTVSSETVDRDINAAKNLRDCPEAKYVSYGSVGAVASVDTRADRKVGTDPGSDAGPSGAGGVAIRPCRRTGPAAVRPKPNQSLSRRRGGTPKGVPET
jgi:putative transposase